MGASAAERAGGGIRGRLRDGYADLTPAQRRLAAFLLENLSTASDYTITDLSDAAGVSIGTISQLCRRLGLKGYQDLRLALAREAVVIHSIDGTGHRLDLPGGPVPATGAVERVFGRALETLVDTAGRLDPDALTSAVDVITTARRVECIGVGTAALVAQEAAIKLRKVGIDAHAEPDGHLQAMSAALLGDGDALLAVSHSGRTIDTIQAASLAREGGARIVVITGQGRSPLADVADVRLATTSSDTGFQVEPMGSTIAALAVVQTIFLMALERGGEAAQVQLARTQTAVEDRHITGRSW